MKNWKSAEEFFEALNENFRYVVLRNWENFFDDLFVDGHEDIDMLCENKNKLAEFVGAKNTGRRLGYNYKVQIAGRYIALDLRCVGDGYYDIKWEKQILRNRKLDSRGFYVMCDEDYFYSLIYHAAYQKAAFSHEYCDRLKMMRGLKADTNAEELKIMLDDFMTKHSYRYSYSFDMILYLNFEGIPSSRIKWKTRIGVYRWALDKFYSIRTTIRGGYKPGLYPYALESLEAF